MRLNISEGYRASLRQPLFRERGRIAKQKELNHYREARRHLRQGGWGKQAMAPRLKPMTTCTLDDGTTLANDEGIANAASTNYAKLFCNPTPTTHDATDDGDKLTKRLQDEEGDLKRWCSSSGTTGSGGTASFARTTSSRLSPAPRPGALAAATAS